ncbi:MAG: LysM peptidoglycan-binding domain-containing protein [Microthrixaceae bacterium]
MAVLAGPLAALVGLLMLDGPRLRLPASPAPSDLTAWWSGRPSLDAVAALARCVAVAAITGLLVCVAVTVLHQLRPGRLSRALVRVVPRWLRIPLATACAALLTAAPVGASGDGGATGAPLPRTDDVPTMWVVGPAATSIPSTHDRTGPPSTVLTAAAVSSPTGPGGAAPTGTPPIDSPPDGPPVAADPAPAHPAGTEVVVRPGDHLWGLAADALAEHLGRSPSEAEVAPYWRATMAANASRLVVRGNPDLILPGQVLVLPPPP